MHLSLFKQTTKQMGVGPVQTHPFYTLHVLSSHITSVAGISFLWTILQQWVTFSGLSGHHLKIDTYHDADFLNHLGHDLELLQLHWNTRLRDTTTQTHSLDHPDRHVKDTGHGRSSSTFPSRSTSCASLVWGAGGPRTSLSGLSSKASPARSAGLWVAPK